MSRQSFHISPEAYVEATNEFAGFCTHCKEIIEGQRVEPDARNYTCEDCENPTVFGLEQAGIEGYVEIY